MGIKSSILLSVAIIGIFSIPVPFAEVTIEENPDDGANLLLSQDSPLTLEISSAPPHATSISLFMGDTVHTPSDTPIKIKIETEREIHTTLKDILRNERELRIPIRAASNIVRIQLQTPTLEAKKALSIRTEQNSKNTPAYTITVRKPLMVALIKKLTAQTSIANDIEYVWKEGGTILSGKNPYARAANDAKNGSKYATYFPLSYIASAGIQKMGYTSFSAWMSIVRPIILISQLLSAGLVLYHLANKRLVTLGLLAFFLILVHRFALYPARVTHIDFPAIAFLLAGMILLPKKPRIAYILIGISLAIKQMAIFILPVLLIYAWHQHKSKKRLAVDFLYITLVPVITLAPFILDNPAGTLQSILFSVERAATGDFASPDIATTLALDSLWARLPMLTMFALVYIAVWRKEMRLFGATLAIFTIFIGFNPVLFFQYLTWVIPFIPLAISEGALPESPSQSSRQLRDT